MMEFVENGAHSVLFTNADLIYSGELKSSHLVIWRVFEFVEELTRFFCNFHFEIPLNFQELGAWIYKFEIV